LHREQIIEQVAAGVRLTDIAKSLGLKSHSAICNILDKDPDFQAARQVGLESRMDQREGELEIAEDNVTVARARELLSHARWRAERECPSRWGVKQDTQQSFGTQGITINIGTVQPGVTIEQDGGGGVKEIE
jgi:hypothetical protein